MSALRWQPLEANPEVMNKYIWSLGLDKSWKYDDVMSLDLLDFIPQPCCAFIFLFPISENYDNFCKEEKKRIENEAQKVDENVFFMKQTIGNACGTIALLHCVANNADKPDFLADNSPLKDFLEKTKKLTPEERGKVLENDEKICSAHETSAREGQSREIGADEKVDLHFVGIVNVDGQMYELDGRKPWPVSHGKCDNFVADAAKICKTFMARDPNETRFNIIALSRAQD